MINPLENLSVSGNSLSDKRQIIGYIHICQIGQWEKPFCMIIEKMKESGLYDAAKEIRCGILNESGMYEIDKNAVLKDPKCKIIYVGKPEEYERPTLLHMRKSAEIDPENAKYFYLHTKGVRYYGSSSLELNVNDWVKLLIYWNVEKWLNAEDVLNPFKTAL